MNKNKKFSLLLLMFILMGITITSTSWGQFSGFGSAITVTHAPVQGHPGDVTFIACTSSQCAAPHVFQNYPAPATHTFPQLSSPYQTFDISAQYTNVNPPYNTIYYNYLVNKADVDAANGAIYDYSNGAQLTIWSTGFNQYSFRIERPVGIP